MEVRIDERGKFFTPRITKDAVAAFIYTTDRIIIGSIYVRPGNRLTDELNGDSSPFLPITDVQVYDQEETLLYRASFLVIAYAQIIMIGELDAMEEFRELPWAENPAVSDPQPHVADPGLRVNERGKFFSVRVPKDALQTLVQTRDHLIVGYFYMRPDRRMKDELNEARSRFLPITDARVYRAADEVQRYHAGFLLIAYAQVTLVAPVEAIAEVRPTPWLPQPSEEEEES